MGNRWYENELTKTILERKYFHDNENFEDFVNRVSGIFSKEIQKDMKNAIKNADFFPAGRILYGAGSEKDGFNATPMNCYVVPSPQDNIESIYDTAKEMARIFSFGGKHICHPLG